MRNSILFGLVCSFLAGVVGHSAFADDDLSKPIFPVDPTQYCAKDASGNYVGAFQVKSGQQTEFTSLLSGFYWAQGGGCILRSAVETWGALLNQKVMVWDGVSKSDFESMTPVPGAAYLFRVRYTVNDIITVKWKMDWHHSIHAGTVQAPQQIVVNYRKIEGTSYIEYWEGTIFLQELAPGVVAFAVRNQINAANTGADDAAASIRDVFNKAATAKSILR